jgi:type IV pilus assembly protein PilM
VIDFKKEIKLSDLVRKTAKAAERSKQPTGRGKGIRQGSLGRKPEHRELVGIKIGASQLAAARVVNNGSAQLRQLARQPLPAGIVADGEVRDVPALAAALNEFFTTNSLPRRGVRLGLASNRVGVRSFEIAGIDGDEQLANAVLYRAHDAVSIPVDEAIIDYRVVSEEVDDAGTVNRKILLVAAYREPIERYAEAFREAGIHLVGIDLEAFALLRAAGPAPDGAKPADAAVVVVNAGHERTTLAVSDGNVCEFTRVLEWGGIKLASAVARDLHLTVPEAGQLLPGVSLEPADTDTATVEDRRSEQAREAVTRELQVLARELVASLAFYQGQPGSLPISEILLAGGTSRIPGLAAELERLTGVRVRLANPLVRVEADASVAERDDLASLAIAIGLGVEG